jgi:virulence-associated protein VapD
MYAICFDLKQDALDKYYPGSDTRNAYGDIRRALAEFGFWNQQGSVYFSSNKDPVTVWKAIDELQNRYSWFAKVVRDLKMLRIEENSDLMPLVRHPTLPLDSPTDRPQQSKLN